MNELYSSWPKNSGNDLEVLSDSCKFVWNVLFETNKNFEGVI